MSAMVFVGAAADPIVPVVEAPSSKVATLGEVLVAILGAGLAGFVAGLMISKRLR